MENKSKNTWIDETLGSLDALARPDAPETIYQRIEQRIAGSRVVAMQNGFVPVRRVAVAAAVIAVLFSADIYLLGHKTAPQKTGSGIEAVAGYYQLDDHNPLYNL